MNNLVVKVKVGSHPYSPLRLVLTIKEDIIERYYENPPDSITFIISPNINYRFMGVPVNFEIGEL